MYQPTNQWEGNCALFWTKSKKPVKRSEAIPFLLADQYMQPTFGGANSV
jgi:hypothetical protein